MPTSFQGNKKQSIDLKCRERREKVQKKSQKESTSNMGKLQQMKRFLKRFSTSNLMNKSFLIQKIQKEISFLQEKTSESIDKTVMRLFKDKLNR